MSKSKFVLDSYAILAFLQQEAGWRCMEDLMRKASAGEVELLISMMNMIEVKYIVTRWKGNTPQVSAAIENLPFTVVAIDDYIEQVIELKAAHPISLADCFAAALAIDMNCPLVTGDSEFKKLADLLQVEWLK